MNIAGEPKEAFFRSDHIEELKRISQILVKMKSAESTLIQIDLLFFDSLSIFRNYTNNTEIHILYSELKLVHSAEYQTAHDKGRTIKAKDVAIRKYKNSIKQILRSWIQLSEDIRLNNGNV